MPHSPLSGTVEAVTSLCASRPVDVKIRFGVSSLRNRPADARLRLARAEWLRDEPDGDHAHGAGVA
jgi:hypothetical protein